MQAVKEVIRGVHVVDTYAHCAIVTDQRMVLVDTSSQADAKPVLDALKAAGIKPRDLTSIIVTHTHPDHVSGLAAVRRAFPAKVAAHEIEAPFIAKERIYEGPPGKQYQKHEGVPVDVRLRDGQSFEGFQVLHTPGHTAGHLSLYDKERRLLIAGDALNTDPGSGSVDRSLGVGTMGDQFNLDPRQHRESIKRLAKLEFDALVVGHGDPIATGAGQRVRKLAARL